MSKRQSLDVVRQLVDGLDAEHLRALVGEAQRRLSTSASSAVSGVRLANTGSGTITVDLLGAAINELAPGDHMHLSPGRVSDRTSAPLSTTTHLRSMLVAILSADKGSTKAQIDTSGLVAGAAVWGTPEVVLIGGTDSEALPLVTAGRSVDISLGRGTRMAVVVMGRGMRFDVAAVARGMLEVASSRRLAEAPVEETTAGEENESEREGANEAAARRAEKRVPARHAPRRVKS